MPPSGPSTRGWFATQVVASGYGSLTARHTRWKAESGVGKNDRCVFEHEVLSRALEYAATSDALNLRNFSFAEFLLRRIQLIEEAVSEDPSNPVYENARLYMGSEERRGGAIMAPTLRPHVPNELGMEAAIMKEKSNAREARTGKGGGRKGKDPPPPGEG